MRVCVCPPLDKGFLPTDSLSTCFTTDSPAGGCPTPEERASNKEALQDVLISARTLADVPAPETVAQAFPLSI